jgi:hypothetical protein
VSRVNPARSSSNVSWYQRITVNLLRHRTTETFYARKRDETILGPLTHASQRPITIQNVVVPVVGLFDGGERSAIFAGRLSNVHYSHGRVAHDAPPDDRTERDGAVRAETESDQVRQTVGLFDRGGLPAVDIFDRGAPMHQQKGVNDGVSHQRGARPLFRLAENDKVNPEEFIDPLALGIYRELPVRRPIEGRMGDGSEPSDHCAVGAATERLPRLMPFVCVPDLPAGAASDAFQLFGGIYQAARPAMPLKDRGDRTHGGWHMAKTPIKTPKLCQRNATNS